MSLVQHYEGRSHYRADDPSVPDNLLVAAPCRPGEAADLVLALLDTAAYWCVLPQELAEDVGWIRSQDDWQATMLTRFGPVDGYVVRLPMLFPAVEGAELSVEATCFISPDWPGPMVVGWKGCLERMRFALDPGDESFYFAELL